MLHRQAKCIRATEDDPFTLRNVPTIMRTISRTRKRILATKKGRLRMTMTQLWGLMLIVLTIRRYYKNTFYHHRLAPRRGCSLHQSYKVTIMRHSFE